jgi:hypothetical protein
MMIQKIIKSWKIVPNKEAGTITLKLIEFDGNELVELVGIFPDETMRLANSLMSAAQMVSGESAKTVVPELTAIDALKR